jgi:anti-sigma factor RsiW
MSKSDSAPESTGQRHLGHLTTLDVELYVDGELTPEAEERVRAHLEQCEPCRDAVDAAEALVRLIGPDSRASVGAGSRAGGRGVRDSQLSQCPGDLELAAFIEGRMSRLERIQAQAHISRCPTCLSVLASAARDASSEPAQVDGVPATERFIQASVREARKGRADTLLSKLWELIHSTGGDIQARLRAVSDGVATSFQEAFTYPAPILTTAAGSQELAILSPFGKTRSPIVFQWERWGNSDSYKISVIGSGWVERTTKLRIAIERGRHAWFAAGSHEWTLRAFRNSIEIGAASTAFTLVGEEEERGIAALERSVRSITPEVDRLAIWGGILEQLGLGGEAVASYRQSHRLRPEAGIACLIARCFERFGLGSLSHLWNEQAIALDRAAVERTVNGQ